MSDVWLCRKNTELGNLCSGDEAEQSMRAFVDASANVVKEVGETMIEKMPIQPVAGIAENYDEEDDKT